MTSSSNDITLVRVPKAEQHIVQNLAAYYTYDMSRYCGNLPGWETPEDGQFSCFDLGVYWEDPSRHPFFIRVDDELAGFALIHTVGTVSDIEWTSGEFFVVSKFQRRGIGREVAVRLFAQFQGAWEILHIPENVAAIAFWEGVVAAYTSGTYSKQRIMVEAPTPHPMIAIRFQAV